MSPLLRVAAYGVSVLLGAAPVPAVFSGTTLRDVRVVARFDRSAGQAAESIAPEPGGGAIVGMIPARQVVRVDATGAVRVLVTMPLPPGGGGTTPVVGSPVVTGVVRTDGGAEYFLYSAGQGGLTGIWRLRADGPPRQVVPLPADTMPNALVVDARHGRFLVTDSAGGRIWQAPLGGGRATVWSADPALAPDGFFGVNGMKIHDDAVWVSNSDRGTILRIPMSPGGRPEVRATGLAGIDDFDFTGRGDEILAAINEDDELVRVDRDGTHDVLLDAADGMQGTTAVVVRSDRVYVTNGANLAGDNPDLLVATLRSRH